MVVLEVRSYPPRCWLRGSSSHSPRTEFRQTGIAAAGYKLLVDTRVVVNQQLGMGPGSNERSWLLPPSVVYDQGIPALPTVNLHQRGKLIGRRP